MSSAGRISKGPTFTPGCFDINWTAWVRSAASRIRMPPNCPFVSAKGPLVTDTLPFRYLNVVAFRALWSASPRQSDRPGEACRRTRSARPSGGCARPRTGCPTSVHRGNPGICISCPPEHGRGVLSPIVVLGGSGSTGGFRSGARPGHRAKPLRSESPPFPSCHHRNAAGNPPEGAPALIRTGSRKIAARWSLSCSTCLDSSRSSRTGTAVDTKSSFETAQDRPQVAAKTSMTDIRPGLRSRAGLADPEPRAASQRKAGGRRRGTAIA
jgi:hypothetical protein